MEFHEVIDKRVTSREWTDREVDFSAIKRIIEAGMKAPTWDHYRCGEAIQRIVIGGRSSCYCPHCQGKKP